MICVCEAQFLNELTMFFDLVRISCAGPHFPFNKGSFPSAWLLESILCVRIRKGRARGEKFNDNDILKLCFTLEEDEEVGHTGLRFEGGWISRFKNRHGAFLKRYK